MCFPRSFFIFSVFYYIFYSHKKQARVNMTFCTKTPDKKHDFYQIDFSYKKK
jgi:hypothetical protein